MNDTKNTILNNCLELFTLYGESRVSIRNIAKKTGIASSVIYHYFPNKNEMLKEMFDANAHKLGVLRSKLPAVSTAKEMLRQRIEFQMDHSTEVLGILKFYLLYRNKFQHNEFGYVPTTAYKHILEVLEKGISNDEFYIDDINSETKVITHAINGFVLEYYPSIPTGEEKIKLINLIYDFLIKALTNRKEVN